jgi:hypothetical protein
MEVVKFGKLDKTFFEYVPTSTIQRLGYLLENELEQSRQAAILFSKAQTYGCKFQKIPLKYSKSTSDCETNERWKIIINEKIEIDEIMIPDKYIKEWSEFLPWKSNKKHTIIL